MLAFQQHFLHVLNHAQPDLWDRQEIRDFVTAIAQVVSTADGEMFPPADFIERVWPHYIHGYRHGGLGRQYCLSFDELLAVATVARVNLVIVSERAGCFHYVGDNLASVADPEQRIVLSSIRGEGAHAIESHFERLTPTGEQALQKLNLEAATPNEEDALSRQAAHQLKLKKDS